VGKFLCSIAEGTSNYLVHQHQENPEIGLDLMQRNAQAMSARDLIESGSRWSDVGLRNRLQKRTATTDYVPDGKGGVSIGVAASKTTWPVTNYLANRHRMPQWRLSSC
jgi:hypothetical protein